MDTSITNGMGSLELFLILLAVVIVAFVLVFQVKSFNETRERIKLLAGFFPIDTSLQRIESSITKNILDSKARLKSFIENPPARHVADPTDADNEDNEEYADVDLIKVKNGEGSAAFQEVIEETNAYLCKNVGTSADFSIIQDICERKIETLETQISNTINVPLYLGLAGTFIGIITGLAGIAFNVEHLFNAGDMSPLRNLLIGVVIAMVASFVGLGLMILNSSINYKKALAVCEKIKMDIMTLSAVN